VASKKDEKNLVAVQMRTLACCKGSLTPVVDAVSATEWKKIRVVIEARDNMSFLWKCPRFVGLLVLLKYARAPPSPNSRRALSQ
jgi:hypothetical protein